MDKIKILKVEPGKPPCVKEIANDFKASQAEEETTQTISIDDAVF